jgi:hypothetical protein
VDDEQEYVEDDEEAVSFKWSKDRVVFLALDYAAALQQATANYFASLGEQAAADHNYKVDRDALHAEVSKEIETLPTFTEPEK